MICQSKFSSKAVQDSYATSNTLFIFNGGPAQRDETADEL